MALVGLPDNAIPIGYPLFDLNGDIPDGFLICNGATLSRSTYSELFSVIGLKYTSIDDGLTFDLPDCRGRFPRILDDGAGIDPNAGTRVARPDGVFGDEVGTTQLDEYRSHNHTYPVSGVFGAGARSFRSTGATTANQSTNFSGGAETRPKNFAFRVLIRAF